MSVFILCFTLPFIQNGSPLLLFERVDGHLCTYGSYAHSPLQSEKKMLRIRHMAYWIPWDETCENNGSELE